MDLRDVVAPVLELMANHMGMMRGTITLLNRQTGQIMIEAAHGLSAKQRERGRYQLGEGVTGQVVQSGRPMVVEHIGDEPHFLDRTGARSMLDKSDISFICVPIKLGNEVIGALSADRLFQDSISLEEDVRLLSVIASMIAQAVRLRQEVAEEQQRLREENVRLQETLKDRFHPANIIGTSKAMQVVYDLIAQVCQVGTTVLIRGESGTGKELVAHAIHYNSLRASKPFIKVNCAALPESVIESELFGHEKGAFTGAHTQRKGRFELANGGTIFLDEVGDLSPATQVKLLRVLQEKKFERVGGGKTLEVDVRILSASNRDLREEVASGRFREDLFYRLNVIPVNLPALRERMDDMKLLAEYFVEKFKKSLNRPELKISSSAMALLMKLPWEGNIRELENTIERAAILCSGNVIEAEDVQPDSLYMEEKSPWEKDMDINQLIPENLPLNEVLYAIEEKMLKRALAETENIQARAAEKLGITKSLLQYKMKKYGIKKKK